MVSDVEWTVWNWNQWFRDYKRRGRVVHQTAPAGPQEPAAPQTAVKPVSAPEGVK